MIEEAGVHLRRLAAATQERAHFSVLQGAEVLTLLSESPGRAVEAVGWVGRVTPAYCTSAGQSLLLDHDHDALVLLMRDVELVARAPNTPTSLKQLEARLNAGRESGAVLCSEEFEVGLVSASAPVRDATGTDRRGAQRLCAELPRRRLHEAQLVARGARRRGRAQRRLGGSASGPAARPSPGLTRPTTCPPPSTRSSSSSGGLRGTTCPPACSDTPRLLLPTSRLSASQDDRRRHRTSRRPTRASCIPATRPPRCFDGRRLSASGAAWANGVLANVLDFDDGHRLTKGHPGAVVIPAALAAAQRADATADGALGGRRRRLRGRDSRRHRAARA